jgi:hypothetical protein
MVIPVKQLQAIAVAIDEHVQAAREHVSREMLLGHSHQAVEAATHVGRLRAEVNLHRQSQTQHVGFFVSVRCTAPSTVRRVRRSQARPMCKMMPEGKTISTRLATATFVTATGKNLGPPAGVIFFRVFAFFTRSRGACCLRTGLGPDSELRRSISVRQE